MPLKHKSLKSWYFVTLVVVMSILIFTGCGYRRPRGVPTTGTVTLDGDPVASATIYFHKVGGGRPAFGSTDENGVFFVSSYGGKDGLSAGDYKVTVAKEVSKAKYKKIFEKAEQRKKDAERASADDQERASDAGANMDFGEAAYENLLPEIYEDKSTTPFTITIDVSGKSLNLELKSAE